MKVLVLSNSAVGLYNFRAELFEELIKKGCDVILSIPNGERVSELVEMGCTFVDTEIDRRGTNPVTDFKLLVNYTKIIKRVKPDIVLTYTVKPNVFGGVACQYTKVPYLSNITGLGSAIQNGGLMSCITKKLYKIGLQKCKCVFFQNSENLKVLTNQKIVKSKYKLIPGSGVNLQIKNFENYPGKGEILKCLFIGRVMRDKGVGELLKVIKEITKIRNDIEFTIIGFFDGDEFREEINEMIKEKSIKYIEFSNEIHKYIQESHVIINPTYHEGLSNVLLEAGACGRPVIATDIPGCKEVFEDCVTGYACRPKDSKSLLESIERFIELPYDKKIEMGINARKKIEAEFDRYLVVNAYVQEIIAVKEH